jgi:hypothetical protein
LATPVLSGSLHQLPMVASVDSRLTCLGVTIQSTLTSQVAVQPLNDSQSEEE